MSSATAASPPAELKQPFDLGKYYDGREGLSVPAFKVVTAEQCGLDERSLLNLHAALERETELLEMRLPSYRGKPGDLWEELAKPPGKRKPNYGELTRFDLKRLHDNKEIERRASAVLEKLEAAGGDAIDYTPEQLKGLPDNLKVRGFALLLNMPERVLNEPGTLRITQQTIDWYTSMHGGLLAGLPGLGETVAGIRPTPKEDLEEVWELAKRLGLQIKVL